MRLEMKRQDMEELFQLLEVYERTYGGRNAREMKEELSARYREEKGGGNISEKSPPRGRQEKAAYGRRKKAGQGTSCQRDGNA